MPPIIRPVPFNCPLTQGTGRIMEFDDIAKYLLYIQSHHGSQVLFENPVIRTGNDIQTRG